jgi:hypothetical protein
MKKIIIIFSLLFSLSSVAQQHYILKIEPVIGGVYHDMNNIGSTLLSKKIKLAHFDYYISNLKLKHDGGQMLDLSDTIFLVEPTNFNLDLGILNVNMVEEIHFGVGVPENLNHLDISAYPENHPLSFQDPTMHWGWAAGYMHMIIGGMVDANNDDVPEKYFELHNLGDANYHELTLPVYEYTESNGDHIITVSCNIDNWISNIDLATVNIKHGETGVNAQILANAGTKSVFSSQQAYLGLEKVKEGLLSYAVNPNSMLIEGKEISKPDHYELINSNGQIVSKGQLNSTDFKLEFTQLKKGIYFFNLYSLKERTHQLKVVY